MLDLSRAINFHSLPSFYTWTLAEPSQGCIFCLAGSSSLKGDFASTWSRYDLLAATLFAPSQLFCFFYLERIGLPPSVFWKMSSARSNMEPEKRERKRLKDEAKCHEREGEGERGSAPRRDKNNDETFTTWKRKQVGDFKIGKWGARDEPRENTHVLSNKCWQKPNNESPYLLSVQIFRHISCSSDLQTAREGRYFNQLHFRGEHNTGINQIWCRSSRSAF